MVIVCNIEVELQYCTEIRVKTVFLSAILKLNFILEQKVTQAFHLQILLGDSLLPHRSMLSLCTIL
jgi:uncharacterized membrane protein